MTIIQDPLDSVSSTQLKKWLGRPECEIFKKVLQSQAMSLEAKVVERLVPGKEAGLKTAMNDAEEIRRIQAFIKLLDDMRSADKFVLVRAVPS